MELTEQLRGYRVELDLNNAQRTACLRHAGAARFAYNFGLCRKQEEYKAGRKTPSAVDLHRELNARKQQDLGWLYQVSKCAPQEALRDLDRAYAHFFRRCKLKQAGHLDSKVGFPRMKRRSKAIGSFRLTGCITITERHIKLPRLGKLRLKERGYLPTSGVQILSATVREQAGHWFVSVQVRQAVPVVEPATGDPVGIDLGIRAMATCSDGQVFENPKALRRHLTRLKRLQRRVSRKVKGSNNRRKARQRLARQHRRVACIRQNALHQATSTLVAKPKRPCERPAVLVREDLTISGMLKNHKLAQAIADMGFGEFKRQLDYKAAESGVMVLVADRWYPSTKRCSACGNIKAEMPLSERTYVCDNPACMLVMDRDLNAARNLVDLLTTTTASLAGSHACGETVRPGEPWHDSLKQEPDAGCGMSING